MPNTTNPMVQFKFGEYNGFKGLTSWDAGTLYVTTDEQGMYFSKDGSKPIKLGNIITFATLSDWKNAVTPPYSADVFYYIANDNALIKHNGTKFVQLNKDYGGDVSALVAAIGAQTDKVSENKTSLWAYINKAQAAAESAMAVAGEANTAAGAAHAAANKAQGTADGAAAKAAANEGSINTINGQISTINGSISDLKTIVETGDNSNAKLREDLAGVSTVANTANGTANDNAAAIIRIDGEIDGIDGQLVTINGAITRIDGEIDGIDGQLVTINGAIERIDGEIDGLESTLGEHGTAITNIQNNYALKTQVESDITAAKTEVNGYTDGAISAAKTELIGTEVTGVTTTIKGVKKYTDEQIAGVNSSITTLRNEIGNIANIMNFRGTFEALTNVTDPVNGDVVIVKGVEYVYVKPNDASEGKWEEFGAATANEARFDAIEQAATALEGRVTALDKATDGRVALIEGRVSKVETIAGQNTTAINTEKGRIDALENTTIPAINAKIGTVAEGTNLAQLIADEASRASGVEGGLKDRLDVLETTTIPGINTAHTTLEGRVTALDQAGTGRVAVAENEINTLKTKTGIASLTGTDTLYGLITAETGRAQGQEAAIRGEFAEADAALRSEINAKLTWGSF